MSVQPFILQRREQVAELCRRTRARRLGVFGSAVRADFDPDRSDLDFLVEFEPVPPAEYAEAFFRLKDGLEQLFGRPVDLLTPDAMRNPWLRRRIAAEREDLYAA